MLLFWLLSPVVGLAGLLYMERVERHLTASISEQQRSARNQRRALPARPPIQVQTMPVHHSRSGRPAVLRSPTQARRAIAHVAATSRVATLSRRSERRSERRTSRRALASSVPERTRS